MNKFVTLQNNPVMALQCHVARGMMAATTARTIVVNVSSPRYQTRDAFEMKEEGRHALDGALTGGVLP